MEARSLRFKSGQFLILTRWWASCLRTRSCQYHSKPFTGTGNITAALANHGRRMLLRMVWCHLDCLVIRQGRPRRSATWMSSASSWISSCSDQRVSDCLDTCCSRSRMKSFGDIIPSTLCTGESAGAWERVFRVSTHAMTNMAKSCRPCWKRLPDPPLPPHTPSLLWQRCVEIGSGTKKVFRFPGVSWNGLAICYHCRARSKGQWPDLYWNLGETTTWDQHEFTLAEFLEERIPSRGICFLDAFWAIFSDLIARNTESDQHVYIVSCWSMGHCPFLRSTDSAAELPSKLHTLVPDACLASRSAVHSKRQWTEPWKKNF